MAEYRGLNESRGKGMPPAHDPRRPRLIENDEFDRNWMAVDMKAPGPLEDRKLVEKRGGKTTIRIKK